MKSHQNLVKIVLILFITFFTPIIDENSLQASDLYKKNLGIATWANDTTLSGWQNNLGWKTHSKQYMKKYEIENNIKLFQVVSEPFVIEDRAAYHTTGKVKYIKESPSWR